MSVDPNRLNSPDTRTLQPTDVLDSVQGAALQKQVEALVKSGVKTVILDCSVFELIDSSGVKCPGGMPQKLTGSRRQPVPAWHPGAGHHAVRSDGYGRGVWRGVAAVTLDQ